MENKELNTEQVEQVEQAAPSQSNKDAVLSRIQAMYPDVDEETMYQNFMEFMDNMDRASKAHAELGQKLTQHPRAALMLADVMDGKHPKVAMKRYFADNEDDMDEEGLEEEILNAERERIADEAQSAEMKAQYEQNLAESAADVQAFKEAKGATDEEFTEFLESCVEMTGDLLSGRLNTTLLENLWKGRKYDSDLANETSMAEERGRISERNTKIEAQKKQMKGDGLPNIGSASINKVNPVRPLRKSAWEK
jgi:hypothetical protein